MSELSRFKPSLDTKNGSGFIALAVALFAVAAVCAALCVAHCTGALSGEGVIITYTPMEDLTPEQRETLFDFHMTDAATMDEVLAARKPAEATDEERSIDLIEDALREESLRKYGSDKEKSR